MAESSRITRSAGGTLATVLLRAVVSDTALCATARREEDPRPMPTRSRSAAVLVVAACGGGGEEEEQAAPEEGGLTTITVADTAGAPLYFLTYGQQEGHF